MRKLITTLLFLVALTSNGHEKELISPNGKLKVKIHTEGQSVGYDVLLDHKVMLTNSQFGLKTNIGDFTKNLKYISSEEERIDTVYRMTRTKKGNINYQANLYRLHFKNSENSNFTIEFSISNNDIAFRYLLGIPKSNSMSATIYEENTYFNFPLHTTTFLCPQNKPMSEWARSKPSYEEEYEPDAALSRPSKYGVGFTFPCLFKISNYGWALISETGVGSNYCGSRLSDYQQGKGFQLSYPQPGENNGIGSASPTIMLPGATPWRTITVGEDLKPIVETTVQFDVVKPLYESNFNYKPGRYTWSWLIWQDEGTIYADQLQFIDLAAKMGYEYCLIDALWDKKIGREGIERLAQHGREKNVSLWLWYNSNGYANDAPQSPRGIMSNTIARKKEFAWMQKHGISGIKVDFFGGDKQETMKLYEDILSDANDYGIQVIFHGCTIPRGWERMYPNYAGSEGALATENIFYSEHHAQKEGFEMSMHPFSRNAIGSFDWGGVIMNKYLSRDNKSRHKRYTGDVFEMATAITNQISVNCVAIYPNNLKELPAFELDFLKQIPTTWEDTKFIEGYPTQYVVLARKHAGKWYVGGLNGTSEKKSIILNLPMFKGKNVKYYSDVMKKNSLQAKLQHKRVNDKGELKVTMEPMGGIIVCE